MRNAEHYPFGDMSTPIVLGGAVGVDKFGRNNRPIDWLPNGAKRPVYTPQALETIVRDYDIEIDEKAEAPGATIANVASGSAKIHETRLKLFTALSPTDPSTERIQQHLKALNVDVQFTPADTDNPYSLVLPPDKNRRILTYKPVDAPAIQMTPNGIRPGAVILSSASGQWEQSLHNGVDYAKATGGNIVLIGSESQLKQLNNPRKLEAYNRALQEAGAFLGNDDEAALIVEANGGVPNRENTAELARQLKRLSNEGIIVNLTQGAGEVVLLDQVDNVHTLQVPPIPEDEIVNTIGAGDEAAAKMFGGFRAWGTSPDGIRRSMQKAAEGAESVIRRKDAQSGQLDRVSFFAPPQEKFRHDMEEASSWHYPTPPSSK